MGHRGTEQCHDAVAHDLVDRALVAVDGLHHQLEDGGENLAGLLGAAASEQLHRAFQIGEQHGHLLAFTLQCGPGPEDLLGQVPGGIRVGRTEPSLSEYSYAYWMCTFRAELRSRRQRSATLAACPRERRGARLAELRAGAILVSASGTLHPTSPASRADAIGTVE